MLSLLTGSEEKAKQLKTDMQGYGTITVKGKEPVTFNEQHSKLAGEAIADTVVNTSMPVPEDLKSGVKLDAAPIVSEMGNVISSSVGTEQLSNAVNNFKQASSNQVDIVAKQSEITSAAITTAEIDSDVSKTVTQQPAIEAQQVDSGDRTADGAAAASNAAALESLVNRTPGISPPANEETFIVMP